MTDTRNSSLEQDLVLIEAIKWKSVDRDNMEFEARVSCYQRDAIMRLVRNVRALEDISK